MLLEKKVCTLFFMYFYFKSWDRFLKIAEKIKNINSTQVSLFRGSVFKKRRTVILGLFLSGQLYDILESSNIIKRIQIFWSFQTFFIFLTCIWNKSLHQTLYVALWRKGSSLLLTYTILFIKIVFKTLQIVFTLVETVSSTFGFVQTEHRNRLEKDKNT